jgi:hypothetical protein
VLLAGQVHADLLLAAQLGLVQNHRAVERGGEVFERRPLQRQRQRDGPLTPRAGIQDLLCPRGSSARVHHPRALSRLEGPGIIHCARSGTYRTRAPPTAAPAVRATVRIHVAPHAARMSGLNVHRRRRRCRLGGDTARRHGNGMRLPRVSRVRYAYTHHTQLVVSSGARTGLCTACSGGAAAGGSCTYSP